MKKVPLNKKGKWLIQRNKEVYDMQEVDRNTALYGLFLDFIKRVDKLCPEAFTSMNDLSVGHLEDLISKGRLFDREADIFIQSDPNECYENCMSLSNNRRKIYMGYVLTDNKKAATLKGIQDAKFIDDRNNFGWIPHCWLVDKKTDEIIETTAVGVLAYFGIQVNIQYIYGRVKASELYPLANSSRGDNLMNVCIKNTDILSD